MVYAFEHPAVESRGFDELEAANARMEMLRSQASPDLGARVVAMHQTWPDIPPGALVGMAMAGIDPGSDIARQIEQRAVEQSSGLGFHSPGEVVDAQQIAREQDRRKQQQASSNPVGAAWDATFEGLKTGVRGAFFGMESAFDEVSRRATSGLVALQDPDRTYAQAMELSTPSQAALVAGDEYEFGDLGEGFIPGGEVREEQERLKQRLTLDGEWMSPGRALARNVAEPGTKPFTFASGLVDAAFNIFGDPATYATAGLGKVRMAQRAFAADSMLVRGIRRMPDEAHARQWWQWSAPGQRLRQSLVDEQDPYEVWRRLGGEKGNVDRDTARLIARASSPQELDEVVLPRLGPQGIPNKPVGSALGRGIGRVGDLLTGSDVGAVHGIGYQVKRNVTDNVRLLQWMPRQSGISIADPDEAVLNMHRFMRGIKATDEEAAPIMRRAFDLGADDATPDNWMEVAKDLNGLAMQRALRDSLGDRAPKLGTRAAKREQHIRENIGRVVERRHEEFTSYFKTEAASPRSNTVTWVDGSEVDLSLIPSLTTEYLSHSLPLPDPQDLRRHIGTYARAMRALDDLPRAGFENTIDMMSSFMSSVWKPMVLLRGAYIARVVGEEQLRMGASGLDSAFRHPASYLAYLTGRKGGRGLADDLIADTQEFQSIAQRKGGGFIGRKPGDVALRDRVKVRRHDTQGNIINDQAFARAGADDLSMLINDEASAIVARNGVDEAHRLLTRNTPQYRRIRRQIAESEQWREVADSSDALHNYLRNVVAPRIEEKTRGNTDLVQAIATGRLDGRIVRWTGPQGDAPSALQKGVAARLDELGIEEFWGRRWVSSNGRGSALGDKLNRMVDVGADHIMSRPTNYMSRFPTWRQAYVRNLEQQMQFMDDATQRSLLRWAREPKGGNLGAGELGNSTIRRLERAAQGGKGTAVTDRETADLIARSAATRDTRRLLYELTEQGQFSDAARAAMPFAEAWKEILSRWSSIVRDRPSVIRRAQQGIEGARGAGMFYQDPSTGEEMFAYPGGNLVSRALLNGFADSPAAQAALGNPFTGPIATAGLGVAGAFMDEQEAEFDLTGRAGGLNLISGSVMPGLGPTVTLPASQLLPERPSFDWLRENVLFPFGEPEVEEGVLESLAPAWFEKMRTGWMGDPETDRIYANSVFDVAKALVANGGYSTDSPEEVERLLATAKERAKGLWLMRGAAQFVAPTGPSPRFRVKDLEGHWWPYQVLASEFYRLQQEEGEDEAITEFLSTFGTDLISLVQSKSRQVVHRPTTEVGDDWIRANDELVTSYPTTVGLIAPEDPSGEFYYGAYTRHFDEGTREQLTPEQMTWSSNNLLGRFAYANAVEKIDMVVQDETEASIARQQVRAELMERFPGFNSHLGVRERPRVDEQIRELEKMVADDRVSDMDAVQGLRDYLEERRKANILVQATADRSTTFKSSQETAWIRHLLRQKAEEISQQHPGFVPLWERVFSRELADDETIQPGQLTIGGSGG